MLADGRPTSRARLCLARKVGSTGGGALLLTGGTVMPVMHYSCLLWDREDPIIDRCLLWDREDPIIDTGFLLPYLVIGMIAYLEIDK
jgi:hypothetical protein